MVILRAELKNEQPPLLRRALNSRRTWLMSKRRWLFLRQLGYCGIKIKQASSLTRVQTIPTQQRVRQKRYHRHLGTTPQKQVPTSTGNYISLWRRTAWPSGMKQREVSSTSGSCGRDLTWHGPVLCLPCIHSPRKWCG